MTLFKVTKGILAFFSLWIIAAFFLYVQGNFRRFSDANLLAILNAVSVGAVLSLFAAAAFIASLIFVACVRGGRMWPEILPVVPAALLAFFALFASQGIAVLAFFPPP